MTYVIQTSFNSGVIGPQAKGRIDLKAYYEGMEQAENIICLPQGGVTRRPGFEYLATLSEETNLFPFEFNVDQVYVIGADSNNWYFFDDAGSLLQTTSHSLGTDVLTADYAQSADSLLVVHPEFAPQIIQRTGASSFTVNDISFQNVPEYDFNDASSPTPTSFIQELEFVSGTEGDVYRLQLKQRDGSAFTSADIILSDSSTVNEENIQEALLDMPVTSSDASTVTVVNSGAGTYDITLSGSSADDYQEVTFLVVRSDNIAFKPGVTVSQDGVSQKEPAWSPTRGYPVSVVFHESRLVLGGTKSLPASLFLSRTNDFFNFKTGSGRDDEAIFVTLDTDQLNQIEGLSSNRNLQIFTSGQEFFVPARPITPGTITVTPQSAFGAKRIKPVVIDGFTIYVQRTGKAVRSFQLTEFETQYDSSSVSLLAPNLIDDPTDMAVQRGQLNIDSSYAYLVNQDGSLAVYSSKRLEQINNWFKWTTSGKFQHVTASGDSLYVTTERTINGATVYFLERLYSDSDKLMLCDAGVRYDQAASPTVSGLGHLDGELIRVVADGAVKEDATPVAGSITLDRDTESGWVGLNYNPTVVTMPANWNAQTGQVLARLKRFIRVHPLLLESKGVYINNVFIPSRQLDVTPLDTVPDVYSGIAKNVRLMGWTYQAQLTITQQDPLPMTVLSLSYEVESQ